MVVLQNPTKQDKEVRKTSFQTHGPFLSVLLLHLDSLTGVLLQGLGSRVGSVAVFCFAFLLK